VLILSLNRLQQWKNNASEANSQLWKGSEAFSYLTVVLVYNVIIQHPVALYRSDFGVLCHPSVRSFIVPLLDTI
jgi:hypothetical protein